MVTGLRPLLLGGSTCSTITRMRRVGVAATCGWGSPTQSRGFCSCCVGQLGPEAAGSPWPAGRRVRWRRGLSRRPTCSHGVLLHPSRRRPRAWCPGLLSIHLLDGRPRTVAHVVREGAGNGHQAQAKHRRQVVWVRPRHTGCGHRALALPHPSGKELRALVIPGRDPFRADDTGTLRTGRKSPPTGRDRELCYFWAETCLGKQPGGLQAPGRSK